MKTSTTHAALTTDLAARFRQVRTVTMDLCAPLSVEDQVAQSMPEASPAKWHLAHTSWFFETFVLAPYWPEYQPLHPAYGHLFNSYYETVGEAFPRARRGLLTRPSVAEVHEYRAWVDKQILALCETRLPAAAVVRLELGIQHEQQHQELILSDIKHLLSCNPLRPAYKLGPAQPRHEPPAHVWVGCPGGLYWIGHAGQGFHFDNEAPRHRTFLQPFLLGSRLVTAGEYLAFMDDRGYERPELWLSDGIAAARDGGWRAPLYWEQQGDVWWMMTLHGMRPVDPAEPVCHVSYYEADAYARWAGARLPTEFEWEAAAGHSRISAGADTPRSLHPAHAKTGDSGEGLIQLGAECWQWTASPYAPYPGFRATPGALGEYNGKFMCNQMVLRGGACATPAGHTRATYRNFFPPGARWQFSGIRLARDA